MTTALHPPAVVARRTVLQDPKRQLPAVRLVAAPFRLRASDGRNLFAAAQLMHVHGQ